MADAEDRTEAATPRRLQRARESGQVPVSKELAPAAVLGAATLAAMVLGIAAMRETVPILANFLASSHRMSVEQGIAAAGRAVLHIAAPVALLALAAGSLSILMQTGFLLNASSLMPDLARLDPRRGLKRIGGIGTLLETGKSLLKIAVVGGVLYRGLRAMMAELPSALFWGPDQLLAGIARHMLHIVLAVLGAQAAIGVFDLLRARLRHARSMRMSRQEIREEHKESEGDPQVKGRRRALQRQRARRRMLSAVPKATVIVTNPTHYAVALAYDRTAGAAPRVVAKGIDEMAARIRAAAEAHRIPMVANPPLARALYQVELDREIPNEHFKAVAEIIAYVWRLRGRAEERHGTGSPATPVSATPASATPAPSTPAPSTPSVTNI